MSTTTIRMPETLREKVREAAERAGITPHGFILQAIAEKAESETLRHAFHEAANQRYAKIVASGETIPWEHMKLYLEQRLEGQSIEKPGAQKWVP
ncbi:DUF6290 family protein [Nevskia sp.]|uniref:CopG family ribbon-helix-helix protein n=1 Tax=Nevskia sp. TaxID=1929292 RepID=UPI0025DEB29B|nr:DUF6290 family protein [Nevskia sp.]